MELQEYLTSLERDQYQAWVEDTLANDPDADVSEEAYADECVARAEQWAEERTWAIGCGR